MIPRALPRSRSSFSRSRRTPIAVVGDSTAGDAEHTTDSSSRSSESMSSLGEPSSSKHTVWGGMAAQMDHPESLQGWLHKKHTHKKRLTQQWGKRYFLLDAEKMLLRYHKSESSKKPRAVFHLSTVSLELVDDGTPHAFNIVTSDLTLTVHAENRADYGRWTGAITAATVAFERKSGRMPSGAAPTVACVVNTSGGAAGVPMEASPAAASIVVKRRSSGARLSHMSAESSEAGGFAKPNRGRRISFDLGSEGALPGMRGNGGGEAKAEDGGAEKRPELEEPQQTETEPRSQPQLHTESPPQPPPPPPPPPQQQPQRLDSASREALRQDSEDGPAAESDDERGAERGVSVSPGAAGPSEEPSALSDSAEDALAGNKDKAQDAVSDRMQAAHNERAFVGTSLGGGVVYRAEACATADEEDDAIEAFVMSESESDHEGTTAPKAGGSPPESQRSVHQGAGQPGSDELGRPLQTNRISKQENSNENEIRSTQIAPLAGAGDSELEHGSGDSDGGVGIGIGDGGGDETHSSPEGSRAAPATAAAPQSSGAEPTWLTALAGMSSSEDDDDDSIGRRAPACKGGGNAGAAQASAVETTQQALSIPPKKQASANDWDSEEDDDGSDAGIAVLPTAPAMTATGKAESSDGEGAASPAAKATHKVVQPATQDKPQAKGEADDEGSDWDDDD